MRNDFKPAGNVAERTVGPADPQSSRQGGLQSAVIDIFSLFRPPRTTGPAAAGVALFKHRLVESSVGADHGGITAGFGGTDAETSLENLVLIPLSEPSCSQPSRIATGRGTSITTPGETFSSEDSALWASTGRTANFLTQVGGAAAHLRTAASNHVTNGGPPH